MKRRVLLLEPNYRNKYPPMGLMKLAMYHRLLGDDVVFYKGDLTQFVLKDIVHDTIELLSKIDAGVNWRKLTPEIKSFIQSGAIEIDTELERAAQRPFVRKWLEHYRAFYRSNSYYDKPRWDRVCVTTLFTFYWDITIETIEFAKKVCKNREQVFVGGIMASLIGDKVEAKTGIRTHKGSLNFVNFPGDNTPPNPYGKTTIDSLPLDYSILEEIDYKYPATEAYYAYATRGCVRTCAFCAVPKLEPDYREYIPLARRLEQANERFGEQKHLLLLDNNAFASAKFDKIIDEIYASGFGKGATFIQPNQLDVVARQLRARWNDRAYTRMAVRLLNAFVEKLEGEKHDRFYALMLNHGLLHDYTATSENVLAVYDAIKEDYENARNKRPVVRFIDFNQGMDARLATPEKMAKLATVAIRPLRIAFDNWFNHKHYVKAIRLAKENGITQMSNYLLYNFRDKPVDLYRRLRLNIDLCDVLGVNIYSFPMKYHPIMDEQWFSNRDYIGVQWTRKAIRTIQAVLNSTAGKIGRGRSFFFKAFGRSEAEFAELIQMPEAFIIKRWDAELDGLTDKWRKAYSVLTEDERVFVDKIVEKNIFTSSEWVGASAPICEVLNFHRMEREDIPPVDKTLKERATSEFEKSCPTEMLPECQIVEIELGAEPNKV